jgi:hypothetical protein
MRKTGCLAVLAFLGFAGGAFAAPATPVAPCASATSKFCVSMPEPGFAPEFAVTAAGFVGLVFLVRKRKTGPSQNR